MSSPIFHSVRFNLLILPAVLSIVVVSFFWFKTVPSDASSSPAALLPAALCAQPRSTIDLVLPPIDFVPTLSAEKLIGSKFQFEVAFDNNLGANTGLGPYLDVIFPASGIDGLPSPDGIALDQSTGSGAEHLGAPIQAGDVIKQVFPVSGNLTHPFTLQTINGTPGDELVTITLPYASYTKTQLPARVLISAKVINLADLNDPLIIKTRAGFRYGCVGVPAPVPSVPNPNDSGTVTPILFKLEKRYDGPEIGPKMGETATGPNFPHHYTIDVYIAPGQQITNLKVTDLLPDNLAFVGLTSYSGGVPGPLPPAGVAASGSLFTITFPTPITGAGLLTPDITIVFEFFIPLNNASGAPILNPNTGASAISENNVTLEGDWSPLDQGDPSGPQILDPAGPEYTLVCKSIALQKKAINLIKTNANVTAPPTDNAPGDFIFNTVDFQVSDYFTFNQLTIEDVLSDGQISVVFPPPAPSYAITDQLHTASANAGSGFTLLSCAGFQAGMRRAVFALPGSLTGGAALATPSTVPATGQLTFRTRITENYVCTPPSGDKSVDQNDRLFNRATIKGTILNNSTLQPIGPMQDDHELQFGLLIGLLTKSVYAHRNRLGAQVLNPPPSTLFAPGDEITFRLKYQLPHGDIETFSVEDFLPLSLLNASQMMPPTSLASCGGVIPPAGTACFGPSNGVNISGLPVVTVNATNNTLRFDYSTFDDPASPTLGKAVDILFTLTIQNNPYMDGQFVINQSLSSESNSFNQTVTQMAGALFRVAEPSLRIRKGIVATTNMPASYNPTLSAPTGVPVTSAMLAANPTAIQSNLGNADAGDLVTFAVVVENIGSSPYGAFDVKINDTVPAGFTVPASLTVTDGNGLPIPFTGTAASFFLPAGIELIDPPFNATTPHGALTGPGASGKNIAVIKYTLQVPATFAPCTNHLNTAKITNYSSTEPAGPNYAFIGSPYGGPFINTRTLSIAGPRISKIMGPTSNSQTTGTNVSAGESVTYNVEVYLPEGSTPNVTVTDLPANMMVTGVGPVNSPNYSVTNSPSISPALPAACGVPVTINFGGPISVPINMFATDNWFRFQVTTRVCSGLSTGQAGNTSTVSAGASCQSSASALQLTIVP